MKDQFRSDERIAQIKAPILVLHGTNDAVIPIAYGERLYALIKGEKRFARLDGAPHEGLDAYGALKHAREFIGAN